MTAILTCDGCNQPVRFPDSYKFKATLMSSVGAGTSRTYHFHGPCIPELFQGMKSITDNMTATRIARRERAHKKGRKA